MRTSRGALPASLRWRLTAWVAVLLLLSAAVVFAVVYEDTGSELRRQIDRDLAGDTAQLVQALDAVGPRDAHELASAAARYMRAQPYTAASTLLFVLVPGQPPASNHPEVFGTPVPEDRETSAQQAGENQTDQHLLKPRIGYSSQRIADAGTVRLHERSLTLGHLTVVAGAGEPLALIEQAQHGLAGAFVLAGAAVLLFALIASYFAGARVSAPLRKMAGVAARVDAGELSPRMDVAPGRGGELEVMAEAFNHMLDRLEHAFGRQREFVADASHELRTPLTVIRGQIEVLAAQKEPTAEDLRRVEAVVGAEIGRLDRLVQDLSLLARAEQNDFLRPQMLELRPFLEDLWDGLSLTAKRRFEHGLLPDGRLRADPDRLAQALRNLARNAIEHTSESTGVVRLEAERIGLERIRFSVVDDGPGIPPDERERIFERFHRTDASRSRSAGGTGLGLAIVRAIAEAHGGLVSAVAPADGEGARVELILPGYAPS